MEAATLALVARLDWLKAADGALRSGPKLPLKAVDGLGRDATKLGVGDCEDARALRAAPRGAL